MQREGYTRYYNVLNNEFVNEPAIKDDLQHSVRGILENHVKYTGSALAKSLLADWPAACRRFLKVIPVGYKMLLKDESN